MLVSFYWDFIIEWCFILILVFLYVYLVTTVDYRLTVEIFEWQRGDKELLSAPLQL